MSTKDSDLCSEGCNLNAKAARKWKIPKPADAIIIAISSKALFDLSEQQKILSKEGLFAYNKVIVENENKPLKPGVAFPFIHALANINIRLLELNPDEKRLFDVVLMSNHSAECGISLINSINYHKLTIERICLTAGNDVVGYLDAYKTDLYLSTNENTVMKALDEGIASATLQSSNSNEINNPSDEVLRIAFDGDAVLFSDEAEQIAQASGLENFFQNEENKACEPLARGPLKKFAMILGEVKKRFSDAGIEESPIRTYLVTARSAASAGIRALKTLRSWGLNVDEALFLAGAPKGPILKKINPHLFFDDQLRNIDNSLKHGINAAHVPYGVSRVAKK